MTVVHVAAVYAAIGAAIAIAARRRSSLVDAALLLGLWPMYAPLLLLAADTRERELLAALRRAAATPLGAVLPGQATARALARRLRDASARLRAIDAVLARPDFDLPAARAQVVELAARDATACAIGTAELRVQTIERVHALRRRFAGDLDESISSSRSWWPRPSWSGSPAAMRRPIWCASWSPGSRASIS